VAAKKTVKKAAKVVKKPAVAAKKTAKAKPVAKKVVDRKAAPAVKKPAAKKKAAPAVAKKAAVKKAPPAVAGKPVKPAKTVKAAARKAPLQKAVAKTAKPAKPVKTATAKTPVKPAAARPSAVARSVVSKPKAQAVEKASKAGTGKKKTAQAVASKATPAPARVAPVSRPLPVGKVAVAVVTKPAKAVPKARYKVIQYKVDEVTGRPILPAGYEPSVDEEYMSPLQLEYFRQRLLDWRADLVEESKQTIENLRDEVRDIGDEAERATRETENSLELRTRDRYRKLIGKIDSTLRRLDEGDYGFCVDTGEEIGLDRLEARLTAERTLDAQERWEHLQKQQGD
jgi:DnaK suppressor protein